MIENYFLKFYSFSQFFFLTLSSYFAIHFFNKQSTERFWKILKIYEGILFLSSYCIHEYLRIEAHLGSKRNNKQNGRTIIGLILLIVHIHRNEEFLQYSLMSTKKNKTSTTSLKFYNNSCSIRSQLSWRTEIRPSPKISCSSGKLSYNGSKFTWQSKVRIF